ncbi:MAG: alpha/beta hydrolase [Chitinophagaceae bacterium]|nr:alpha/beta hydrolase [Chitinophagaceae bacterium]
MKKILKILLRVFLVLFVVVNIITAFHAYKFTHFYDNGSVEIKRPEDKSGWEKTKEILIGIKAVKQKNYISTDTGFQPVTLITKSKLKLQGWYLTADKPIGTVCLFHGHGSTKSAVFKESEAFRKLGYNTLLIDFRAHGDSEGNTSTIGYDETEDVKLAYDYVAAKGEKNIILWGISMGAACITKAMNDYPLQPRKIILEMPFGSILEAGEGCKKENEKWNTEIAAFLK